MTTVLTVLRRVALLLFLFVAFLAALVADPLTRGSATRAQADSCLGGCPHAHVGPLGITWLPPKPIIN